MLIFVLYALIVGPYSYCMSGWVTEKHLDMANQEFPGIREFYFILPESERPKTFLELMVRFENAMALVSR